MIRKIAVTAIAVVGVGGSILASTGAGAASDTEAFHIVQMNDTSIVTAHGVFNASGVDISRGQTDRLVFPDGSLIINHPDSDGSYSFKVNPATCVARAKVMGSYTLSDGKRAYKGISGSGMYQAKGVQQLARKDDGSCDFNAEPVSGTFDIHASGPVAFMSDAS